jgi:hypothetical protein
MRKEMTTTRQVEGPGLRMVAAASLALTLVAFGCTTNNNPGNGQPSNAPSVSPSSTPGASSGATSNPSMSSS